MNKLYLLGIVSLVLPCVAQQNTKYETSTPTISVADKSQSDGLLTDWSQRHVRFSDPGTREQAIRDGRLDKWETIVGEPRYRMQQVKRYGRCAAMSAVYDTSKCLKGSKEAASADEDLSIFQRRFRQNSLQGDWAVTIAPAGHGVSGGNTTNNAPPAYPAKYTFSPIGTPDCTVDFVVFPIDQGGSSTQGSIVGFNNLYANTCTGTVPTELFSYNVGRGFVVTSPVLSLDGTKVAFVVSDVPASFHVVTLDKSGNSGCATNSSPCNGAAYNTPATPGTNNSAVDIKLVFSGSTNNSYSSPFVDYQNDVAYAGDDKGQIHKFTGVFKGTPAEAGSPWPVQTHYTGKLTGVVYDSVSQKIFANAYLAVGETECVTAAGAQCSPAFIGANFHYEEVPVVDSTWGTIFLTGNDPSNTNKLMIQTKTDFSSVVNVVIGHSGTNDYQGEFDNNYYTNVNTGHLYMCGNNASGLPTMYRVGFNSSGIMNNAIDSGSFQLVTPGSTANNTVSCTPMTEVYNASQGKDYLFVGVQNNGFSSGSPNCSNTTCLMSFSLPTAPPPDVFPFTANSTLTTNLGSLSLSGIIVDNVSTAAGASQIYFGNTANGTAVQASQSALR